MVIAKLLERLLETGVRISVKENSLLLISTSGKISQELEKEVRASRTELLEYFKKIHNARNQDGLAEILFRNTTNETLCYRQQNWWRAVHVGRGFSPVGIDFLLDGEYHQEILADSFIHLAERQEILKAVLSIKGNSLHQRISEKPLNVEFYDLSHLKEDEAWAEISRISGRMSGFPHIPEEQKLGTADQTLFSAACVNLKNRIYICMYLDHIISDGYSMKILADEFREIYRAKLGSEEPDLPRLPFQYLDYVAWSNQLNGRDSAYSAKLHAFWKEHCKELTVTRLHHEHTAGIKEGDFFQSEHIRFGASGSLSKLFLTICKGEKYPVFSALITIFFVAVSRFMNQSNPTVATILSGRDKAGMENLVGSFAEMVYVRLDVPERISYPDLITECNNLLNEVHENLFIDWTIYLREEISASYIARDEDAGNGQKRSVPSTGFAFSIEPGLDLPEEQKALYTDDCTYFTRKASYTSANFIWFRIFGYDERILCDLQYETKHFSREKMSEFMYLFRNALRDFCEKHGHPAP